MVIGVIGGVGAGKSTVLETLRKKYGYKVLKTDDIAKSFYVSGNPVFEKLKELLGNDIEKEDGSADIKTFAAKLYGSESEELRERVDGIVHPAVWDYVGREVAMAKGDVVVETALPNDSFRTLCDEIWAVCTDEEVRVERLMKTRGYTEKKARDMILSQISDEEYSEMAGFVIDNSGTPQETVSTIMAHMTAECS
ncbi:dephospho-CoA kinase [Oribacterium sp. WCC10]|uniref:dephospho-CoA kinase n=1 Tax=Oribacterium sp. WCC10 TaxID=1855343 RepID=UPI0008E79236|nr:dephospho-CoA kinase [Oribacterium sp. WCC10]SFG07327.1 dephospho-CoA kinase [Oribacterium sp. WCC10]